MENLWVLIALISAFTLASSDAFTKKALTIHNEYLIAWLRLLLSLPLLFISLFFAPIPPLDRDFYTAFAAALPLEIIATILYTKALKHSPMGLTLPFLSLTPVFLLIVPYILLGEKVSLSGAIGILFIAVGSYLLNLREFKKGIFEPLTAIKNEKGSVFMIIVAFIYSITSSLGKMAVVHSSPLFFGVTYVTVLFIFFTPVALYKGGNELSAIFKNGAVKSAIVPGLFNSVSIIANMVALSLAKVAYMISVKRLSLLFSVLYGYVMFKESDIREKLLGVIFMITGVLLITLYR